MGEFGTLQETAATWKEYAESLQEQYNEQRIEYEQEIDRLSENMKAMKVKYQTLQREYNSMKREYEQIVPPNPLNPKSHQDRKSKKNTTTNDIEYPLGNMDLIGMLGGNNPNHLTVPQLLVIGENHGVLRRVYIGL